MDLEVAQRGVRDAEERVAKLELDKQWFIIKAPADGIMTKIDLEPHDMISARSTICEILNSSKLMVKMPIVAEDLRVIQPGGSASEEPSISIILPEYPK
jgi:multidrug resistance efflux pump